MGRIFCDKLHLASGQSRARQSRYLTEIASGLKALAMTGCEGLRFIYLTHKKIYAILIAESPLNNSGGYHDRKTQVRNCQCGISVE